MRKILATTLLATTAVSCTNTALVTPSGYELKRSSWGTKLNIPTLEIWTTNSVSPDGVTNHSAHFKMEGYSNDQVQIVKEVGEALGSAVKSAIEASGKAAIPIP